MPAARPILIAGAGIGGLTLAISMARRGIETAVIERAPRLEEVGAGLQISPNASRVLDRLGLGPELDEDGIHPDCIRLIDGHSGRPLAQIPLGFSAERRWGAPYRLIHRAHLQTILARAATDAGVPIRLGTELVDFDETGHGVAAHLRGPGGKKTVEAAGLVGADGTRSLVRTKLGGEAPRFSGYSAWRATVQLGGRRETGIWIGRGAHLITYPLDRSGTLNLVAVTRGAAKNTGYASPGRRDELLQAFADWAPPVQTLLKSAAAWANWPLYEGGATKWSESAVTLIGDAAHPLLPHMAQGAAMAIEDAAVLAARLGDTPHNPLLAFRDYETARSKRIAAVQAASRRNGTIFRMGGPGAFARDTALRLMGQDRLMARFDWLYGYRAQ